MVYRNQFVAVVTCRGKILRESRQGQEDVIRIPFGEEYGIRLKNLSNLRAVVDVSVDGVDALNTSRIVLGANKTHDLEGFMEGNTVKNRFKFIKKTEQIADYRGDKIEDGIIQIKYQFEKEPNYIPPITWDNLWDKYPHNKHWNEVLYRDETKSYGGPRGQSLVGTDRHKICDSVLRSSPTMNCFHNPSLVERYDDNLSERNLDSPQSNEGITVKGSSTNVNYSTTYLRELYPDISTIVFKLIGETGEKKVKVPVMVKTKLTCPTCGIKNTSRNKYCSNCGTCLE